LKASNFKSENLGSHAFAFKFFLYRYIAAHPEAAAEKDAKGWSPLRVALENEAPVRVGLALFTFLSSQNTN
jgi:hypothetical protein